MRMGDVTPVGLNFLAPGNNPFFTRRESVETSHLRMSATSLMVSNSVSVMSIYYALMHVVSIGNNLKISYY